MDKSTLKSIVKEKKEKVVGFLYRHRNGIIISALAALGYTLVTKLSSNDKSDPDSWLETASDEELADAYEEERLAWEKSGKDAKTPEMRIINNEMNRRDREKNEREHPNAKPVPREHGWYLPNDDD